MKEATIETSEVSEAGAVNGMCQTDAVGHALGQARPRYIETHIPGERAKNQVVITAADEPGPGGANHQYIAWWPHKEGGAGGFLSVKFQRGGIAEVGTNGITNEALLAIVRDRLECFQRGPFACEENHSALEFVIAAMESLHARTRDRVARNVEGEQEA